ncbi:LPS translocon maturation chaperone LptM [Serratia microhaemolytica]|uniref:LPS translocon maturation chaperone LptM n=1 Tax=Serratia microhaemolytica TaxID=2675110 RepID=UPI000FDD3429|nr:lipoprotein [Serratia microhaemolytica]
MKKKQYAIRLALITLVLATASGCGQKGPLSFPSKGKAFSLSMIAPNEARAQ